MKSAKNWILAIVAAAVVGGGYYFWRYYDSSALPAGIAAGNGRIEAVEIDISARTPGRIREIMADEGVFVEAGAVLARMDTEQMEAQRRQLEAQLKRATIGIETAHALVKQRESENAAAQAVVAQREAQQDVIDKKLVRSEQLARTGNLSQQLLDNDRAAALEAAAAVNAARAQLAATEAGISAAQAQVVDAEAAVDAARAAIESISADINDAVLTAPRAGRVQYRVAQPGEILPSGGRVLNLVDVGDVYMTFFLPTAQAGRVAMGTEVRIVLDAVPQYVIPAKVSFVADVAQFTPKTVETEEERQKLMFRVKAQISPELLRQYIQYVKTGLPGVAYVKLDPEAEWPAQLREVVSP
jgi:HlyD family secretion protein